MIDKYELARIIKEDNETPTLEFKREWYWNDKEGSNSKTGKQWGEFIKDILGLANGYLGYVGKTRYLIIGIDENDRTIHEVDYREIQALSNLIKFNKQVINKIESFAKPSLTNIKIYWMEIEQKQILVIEIPSPPSLVELVKEIQTKTKALDSGAVLLRKGQDNDSVRLASPKEFQDLNKEFDEYKKQQINGRSKLKVVKERSIEQTVLSYLNKNESFSLNSKYPKAEKNWDENIIYEVYKIQDPLGQIKYFIYIHESASQAKTFNYLKSKSIIGEDTLIVLTEKPESLEDPENRKKSLKGIFKTETVFFIDEFGYEFLYKNCISDYEPFDVSVFVESYSESDLAKQNDKTAFENLKEWYHFTSQPILAIKGYGGIGKTTLVKYFLDTIYNKDEDIGLLFIDSNAIISELSRLATSNNDIDDIFDFYQALYNSNGDGNEKKIRSKLITTFCRSR